ncbi:MAG: DUF6666 family protein [Planctomycetota bacterium]|nr:DUF6666 family protein [Planctomycetota bacterium]
MAVSRVARQQTVDSASKPMGIYGRPISRVQYDNVEFLGNETVIDEETEVVGEPLMAAGLPCGDCGVCDACRIYCPPYQLVSFADMEYFAGVQGFKGVPNLGQSGSFGFNEGINWGFPVPMFPLLSLSGQIGFRFTQSEFNGSNFTSDTRDQLFLTGGISRRVDYGLQMGVAVDYLNDNWYFDGSFAQLRSEFGLVGSCGNQIGFRLTANLDDDSQDISDGLSAVGFTAINNFEPVDTYRFFYRHAWDQMRGGHVEWMAGFTENGDGLVGTDFLIPIAERWALNSNFTCLLPTGNATATNQIDESWNVGLGLTWYPKGLSTWSKLYHRPLFDVADNGSFMFQR